MHRLVLVTGPPAAGKTTLATSLGSKLGLPILSKDTYKERLFSLERPTDVDRRAWSERLSDAAWDSLFLDAAQMSGAVIEGNIPSDRSTDVQALHPAPLEIFCRAPVDVLVDRLTARTDRHPGHDDERLIEELSAGRARGSEPLRLGPVLEVHTDKPVDISAVGEWIAAESP